MKYEVESDSLCCENETTGNKWLELSAGKGGEADLSTRLSRVQSGDSLKLKAVKPHVRRTLNMFNHARVRVTVSSAIMRIPQPVV